MSIGPQIDIVIQNKKNAGPVLLLVPHFEALVCPLLPERATQTPRLLYSSNTIITCDMDIQTQASIVALSLTVIEIYQIPKCQEQSVNKRFFYNNEVIISSRYYCKNINFTHITQYLNSLKGYVVNKKRLSHTQSSIFLCNIYISNQFYS